MINDIQSYINGLSAGWRDGRSNTQMTLGKLIVVLEEMDPDTIIQGLGELDSYRGYYSDLAFDPVNDMVKASDLLAQCKAALGATFTGYKGGEFYMDESTPLFIAPYGSCGPRLMSMELDGTYHSQEEDD
ncbi:hypothetical protein OAP32_00520 [Crocinitomicaceae bacterium]|nr:hypothetical protein [Crocinitomicaceae bacterium]